MKNMYQKCITNQYCVKRISLINKPYTGWDCVLCTVVHILRPFAISGITNNMEKKVKEDNKFNSEQHFKFSKCTFGRKKNIYMPKSKLLLLK